MNKYLLILAACFIAQHAPIHAYSVKVEVPQGAAIAGGYSAALIALLYASPILAKATLLSTSKIFKATSAISAGICGVLGMENLSKFIKEYQESLNRLESPHFDQRTEAGAFVIGTVGLLGLYAHLLCTLYEIK